MIIATTNMRGRLLAFGALLLACAAMPAAAGDEIIVKQAWSRATPKGAQVAGGYLTIENHGVVDDKLISAATPAATKVEIHEMTTLDGIMMMRPVEGGLVIRPGDSVTFAIDPFIEIEDADEKPLAVQGLSVTLSDPEQGIAPLTAKAERVSGDKWRARMPAAASGRWSLALGIDIAANDRVDIAAPILVEK